MNCRIMHQLTRRPLDPNTMGPDGKPSVVIRAYELKGGWPGGTDKTRMVIKFGRDAQSALFGRVYVTEADGDVKTTPQQWTLAEIQQGQYDKLPMFKKFADQLGLPAASAVGRLVLDKAGHVPAEPPPAQRQRRTKVSVGEAQAAHP